MAEAGPVVLDASVAIRWLVTETGSDEAVGLLDQASSWLAPRLLVTEIASALRQKVERDELDAVTASQVLDAILAAVEGGMIRLAADEDFVAQALDLALSTRHKLPDCMYLALAERASAALATADRRLAKLASRRNVRVLTVPHA